MYVKDLLLFIYLFKIKLINVSNFKKGKNMDENDVVEKFQNLLCLVETLDDSLEFCWNEGMQGYHQYKLSKIIKREFYNLLEELDPDYMTSL